MPIDPETFSELTNALQQAVLLARRRAVDVRSDVEAADALYHAVMRAADAANRLRPNGDGEQS